MNSEYSGDMKLGDSLHARAALSLLLIAVLMSTASVVFADCNGLSTDKSYYYLGETVNVALCYTQPKYCTDDLVKFDVIVLHEGSQVAQLGTFQGSSTLGCWPSSNYKYVPADDGLYTVQFVREGPVGGSPFLISETQFQVGYRNANGSPVGGVIAPADRLVVLAPYLVLIGLVGAAVGAVLLATRKKRRS